MRVRKMNASVAGAVTVVAKGGGTRRMITAVGRTMVNDDVKTSGEPLLRA